jgi:hypothetical protein
VKTERIKEDADYEGVLVRFVRVFREKRSGAAGVDRPAWRKLCREAQLRRFERLRPGV